MSVKENQLYQLHEMHRALGGLIESYENDEIIVLDGRMNNEINAGSNEDAPGNELYISIDFVPNKLKKPPEGEEKGSDPFLSASE